jgi:nucleoside 2-deoxyribosyltransferase
MNNSSKRLSCYTAAGWFNPTQAEDLSKIESIIDSRASWIDIKSPRRIFVCPPNAPDDVQEATFQGNLEHIRNADFIVASTVGPKVDVGTVWECGYAFAVKTPIVYICVNLPSSARFNLMLAKSSIKVCLSYEQLEDYLDRCKTAGKMLVEPYDKEIE